MFHQVIVGNNEANNSINNDGNSEDNKKKNELTNSEKKDLKEYLTSVYEINEDNITIT